MLAIEVKNLSFTYSRKTPYEKRALDNVTFSVEEGEFVGLIGCTGSGKSTLIQHLNGLVKLQEGEVTVAGLRASDKKSLKKLRFTVGMVFQYPEYQLFEDTVAKDVAFGPRNMKLHKAEIDRRVRRAMDVVGLPYDEFASRSPFELSGGEKRRAAIAGVIAMEPSVLVLDEPVAGLDPAGRKEILDLIVRLKEEVSPTVVMVSHYMDDIAALATRIIALRDGKVVADGSPKDVFGDRERAKEAGIDLPFAARVVDRLAERGICLDRRITTLPELADALAEYRAANTAREGADVAENEGGAAAESEGRNAAKADSRANSRAECPENAPESNGGEGIADVVAEKGEDAEGKSAEDVRKEEKDV